MALRPPRKIKDVTPVTQLPRPLKLSITPCQSGDNQKTEKYTKVLF